LNHAVRLALKAIAAVIVSKAVAIALKTVAHLHLVLKVALKVAAISVLKVASNHAANNAVLHLAVAKAVLSPVAINAQTTVAVTASKRATTARAVHPVLLVHPAAETMPAVAQAIASHPVAPRSLVQATSSPTTLAVMQHPSALALKC
jgi:hypothetical protein